MDHTWSPENTIHPLGILILDETQTGKPIICLQNKMNIQDGTQRYQELEM